MQNPASHPTRLHGQRNDISPALPSPPGEPGKTQVPRGAPLESLQRDLGFSNGVASPRGNRAPGRHFQLDSPKTVGRRQRIPVLFAEKKPRDWHQGPAGHGLYLVGRCLFTWVLPSFTPAHAEHPDLLARQKDLS